MKNLFKTSFRLFSTNPPSRITAWIQEFNDSVAENPKLSLATYLFVRNATWYALVAAIGATCNLPPALGIGFLLAKFTGKIRQPVNIALAALLSKAFPILTTIKSAPLLGLVYTPETKQSDLNAIKEQNEATANILQRLSSTIDYYVVGPVDTYGFSLFIASKINVVATVVVGTWCIQSGMDAGSLLSSLGISQTMQAGGGAMGAATLTNAALLPLHLYGLPFYSSIAALYWNEYSRLRGQVSGVSPAPEAPPSLSSTSTMPPPPPPPLTSPRVSKLVVRNLRSRK